MKYSKISQIIEDAKKGKMFILVDDEQRENEGDLIIPKTLKLTNLIKLKEKDLVNIEFDILSKYIKNIIK